jgi:hypothetical protein
MQKKFNKFNVEIVKVGGSFGLNDCLTNDGPEPLVEFYDGSINGPAFGERGQFVARYNMSSLQERVIGSPQGLILMGGIPQWVVEASDMDDIVTWLNDIRI